MFIDFYYTYAMLEQGGYMVIDDVQLHSVKELARFLIADTDRFELSADLGKTLVFRKRGEGVNLGDWNLQPYIQERTRAYERLENPFSLNW